MFIDSKKLIIISLIASSYSVHAMNPSYVMGAGVASLYMNWYAWNRENSSDSKAFYTGVRFPMVTGLSLLATEYIVSKSLGGIAGSRLFEALLMSATPYKFGQLACALSTSFYFCKGHVIYNRLKQTPNLQMPFAQGLACGLAFVWPVLLPHMSFVPFL